MCGLLLVAWTEWADWEWSPFGTTPFFTHYCQSCSCLLSIYSTIQSSNISAAACFWHFCFVEWGALLCLFTWFIWHPNLGEPLCSLYIFSLFHVPPSYLCHAYFWYHSQLIHFVSAPLFSVDCCGFILLLLILFANKPYPVPLPFGLIVTIWMI